MNLKTWFPIRRGLLGRVKGHVKAVDGVSFSMAPGEVLALVGESGCGKTTVGRTILRLIPATEGKVMFEGVSVFDAKDKELMAMRERMQIIFQDPYSSLNPRMTVGSIVGEGLVIHGRGTSAERREKVAALLTKVGLNPDYMSRYPHEFSGGQRQRIGIARALALSPKFIVCDEAVSALDVSVQAQVLNLLKDLKNEMGLSYLFIAHNLSVVEHLADRVAVMYLGRIVELCSRDDLYRSPRHPYTQALLSAIPEITPGVRKERKAVGGELPSPANPPSGCHFHPRCPLATERCRKEVPVLRQIAPNHQVSCHEVK
ncbi:MAG: ABC transporter ATP-binding protein [Planctomycetota bacterium]